MISAADLTALFGHLLATSLLAVGGALAVIPELHHVFVTNTNLLTEAQFNSSIALAQAAPGPNVLFVAVMGYHVAGAFGAMVALVGILLPSTTLAYAAARWGHARRDWRSVRVFKTAMAPIVIGLLFATGWIVSEQVPGPGGLVTATAAALLTWRTRAHAIVLTAAGAAAGAAGWI